jgi:hypothetical protein
MISPYGDTKQSSIRPILVQFLLHSISALSQQSGLQGMRASCLGISVWNRMAEEISVAIIASQSKRAAGFAGSFIPPLPGLTSPSASHYSRGARKT